MQEITQELVRSLFDYRDGELYWKKLTSPKSRINIGSKAGTFNGRYYKIKIECKLYSAHRLIFLYHNGFLPEFLDHIDNNSLNNKIENLREVTASQNCMNRNSHKNSSSIYKGVSWHKSANNWRSKITIDGKQKHLGHFTNEIDAAIAYNNAAIKLFGEYVNLNGV